MLALAAAVAATKFCFVPLKTSVRHKLSRPLQHLQADNTASACLPGHDYKGNSNCCGTEWSHLALEYALVLGFAQPRD
jgi:hypothetical protein